MTRIEVAAKIQKLLFTFISTRERGDTKEILNALNEASIPEGGLTGKVLKKKSDTDYDLEWGEGGDGQTDRNVDGGAPDSIYLPIQKVNGGEV